MMSCVRRTTLIENIVFDISGAYETNLAFQPTRHTQRRWKTQNISLGPPKLTTLNIIQDAYETRITSTTDTHHIAESGILMSADDKLCETNHAD